MRSNEVKFDGWSKAAWRFRVLAALRARRDRRVLIVGEPGTPLEKMAHAWAAAAGKLKVVDLDKGACSDARFVGFSTAATKSNLRSAEFINLHTGCAGPLPKARFRRDATWVTSNFTLRLYVPPLRQRSIDVIALLYNLQRRSGRRWKCKAVAPSLLCRALCDAFWQGNDIQAEDYFRQAAIASAKPPAPMREVADFDVFKNERIRKRRSRHQRLDWLNPHEDDIEFSTLPAVALSTVCMAWTVLNMEDRTVRYCPIGGSWEQWSGNSIKELAKLTKRTRFLERFLPVDSRPGWKELFREMAKVETFGASFNSLAAGFDVRRQPAREGLAKAKRTCLTDREAEISDYMKAAKDSGQTQRHVAELLGVSPSYLSQVQKKAGAQRNSKSARQRISKSVRAVSSNRLDLLDRNGRRNDGDAVEDDYLD